MLLNICHVEILFDYLFEKETKLNEKETFEIIYQILFGIEYMHEKKDILHLDLNPHNIIFNEKKKENEKENEKDKEKEIKFDDIDIDSDNDIMFGIEKEDELNSKQGDKNVNTIKIAYCGILCFTFLFFCSSFLFCMSTRCTTLLIRTCYISISWVIMPNCVHELLVQ